MRIGVISDTHIPQNAKEIPNIVLEDFKNVDMIIHAGDLTDLSVLQQLKTVCPLVKAVWGNMDSDEVKKKLPEKEFIKTAHHKIGILHGYGNPAKSIDIMKEAFSKDFVSVIIFGHSHCATNEIKDGVLYFNPGSPTDKIFSIHNSYGVIEVNDKIEAKIIKL